MSCSFLFRFIQILILCIISVFIHNTQGCDPPLLMMIMGFLVIHLQYDLNTSASAAGKLFGP